MNKAKETSWGKEASWYDEHLSAPGTYHESLLLPNLLRLVAPHAKQVVLDLACGQGYFTRAFAHEGATMIGVDIGKELIALAKKASPDIEYHVSSADSLPFLKDHSVDAVTIVLAIQNIDRVEKLCKEVRRVLKPDGAFHIVMNHPAFRIPKKSDWFFDETRKVQVRTIEQYLSEAKIAIDMHPGRKEVSETISFHRPLQYYFKILTNNGFVVDRLEEWSSQKTSVGPRSVAENRARKEIPLFMYLRVK